MRAKLFVGNLAYDTGIEKLEALFRPFAGYLHTKICYDRHTGKPLGYAVVHFDNPAAAQYAIDVLHNIEVDGRSIVVAPYRPRVGDPSAPKQPPKAPGGPSADEAIALVMDLHKSATWMDLKDILSQQSKVLFVDEPRMVRAAVVHFASEQDRDHARAVFRNSSILGNAVDIVPVDRDSVVLDPGLAGSSDQHAAAMMPAPHMPAPMVPMTYMSPGMPGLPQFGRMEPAYGMQRPGMWPGPGMSLYAQMMPGGPGPQANLQAAAAAAFQAMASTPSPQQVMPVPALAGHADLPRQPSYSGPSDFAPPLPPQSQPPPPPQQQPPPPPSPQQQGAGFAGRSSGDAGGDAGANLSPELQQLVRQLALSQLGHRSENP
eukprot:jgi/Ulvmu1/4060/UM019_0038.1